MATSIEILTSVLTLGGLVYLLLALWGARDFGRHMRTLRAQTPDATSNPATPDAPTPAPFAPAVSILKPLKGVDPRMYLGLASHCRQVYPGPFEILFGVSSLSDPAVPEIHRLQSEFPHVPIRIIHCTERLGASGKVTNLVQMLPHAAHPYILINDSDIRVSPHYLSRIMQCFHPTDPTATINPLHTTNPTAIATNPANTIPTPPSFWSNAPESQYSPTPTPLPASTPPHLEPRTSNLTPPVGLVTAPYLGHTSTPTLWSRLEALGISTDFLPGVLAARKLEGGIRFGLGSTLAASREALDAIGGLLPLVNSLADDYELGARIARAGFRVELAPEVVETSIPPYTFRPFWDHQLRWARSTRDSRRWGYLGLGITFCLPWALLNCVATGFVLWSFSLLSLVLLARTAVALAVGVGILNDPQTLRDLWLLPLRDCTGLLVWAWSFASDTVIWRGERFRLHGGHLTPLP